MANEGRTIRVTVDLSFEMNKRLEETSRLVGAMSKAEVVRNALRLYTYLAHQAREGIEFIEKGPDGKERRLVVLI